MGLNKRLIGAGATASSAITPSENFKVVTYDGNGGTNNITVGFKPDFVWIKERGPLAEQSNIYDSTRGVQKFIVSNSNAAEVTGSTGRLNAFNSDGFTVGSDNEINDTGSTYVAWCWKANGGTTSSNTDGSITSTVQANTDAGFSIVSYTGTGSAATVGHGLDSAPEVVIVKNRSSVKNWWVWHTSLGDGTKYLKLNGTDAVASVSSIWNSTVPTSTVFSVANDGGSNASGENIIAYVFKSTDGFSKFGSYTGNGSDNGPIVETGFEPAFLMIKNTSSTESGGADWLMYDNVRSTTNPRDRRLYASGNYAEAQNDNYDLDFLSNGFQIKSGTSNYGFNNSGDTYIYMAFATDPDTEAPTLASSFNIETYTGTGAARSVTGFGFSPNFVWLKQTSAADNHTVFDTIRGVENQLYPNLNNSTGASSASLTSFDSDGFHLGTSTALNDNGEDYVAWTWKADDDEPKALFDSVVTGVYKFEDNVNDVAGNNNGANPAALSYTSSGKFNKAIVSNGSNSEVSLQQTPPMTTAWTFSFWFYATANSGIDVILQTGTGFAIGLEISKIFIFTGGSNRGSGTSISLDTWYHYAATYDGTSVKTYLNGSLEETITTLTGMSAGNLKLFDPPYGSWEHYEGRLDQLRVYSTALTSTQITALYNESASDNDTVEFPSGLPTGSANSLVSVNSNAGFSIAQATFGGEARIQHGLSSAPEMVILKGVDAAEDWQIYHSAVGTGKYLSFSRNNGTDAPTTRADSFSSVTATSVKNSWTGSVVKWIMYSFHDIAGYQKIGSYTGDGSAGQSITTGFKPDFVLLKSTVGTANWHLYDTRRNRGLNQFIQPNNSDPQEEHLGNSNPHLTMTSTGFTITADGSSQGNNSNGNLYIYWAVAKNVPSNTTLASSFGAVFYAGSSTDGRTISTFGFKPDLVWNKALDDSGYSHFLTDSLRGGTKVIKSNSSDAEITRADNIQSFDSGGYTIDNDGTSNYYRTSYIAWGWKAGNTWESNIDGTIPSTVNTNTANGFSIVKYAGTQAAGATVGHGLSSAPELIIVKRQDYAEDWVVYNSASGNTKTLNLNNSDAEVTDAAFNNTTPTSSVFTLSNCASGSCINSNSGTYIAYCWHSVSNYSKIGSYTGNGSATGPTITTGFKTDFVLIKRTDGANSWAMVDSLRGGDQELYANLTDADNTFTAIKFLSDGFQIVNTANGYNANGGNYIYMALKKNATNNTTKEKSFAVKTYTGNGSTQEITGIGFKADLVWIKQRNDTNPHSIFDTTRGAGKLLVSSTNAAESGNAGDLVGYLLDDGFQVNRNYDVHSAYDNTNHSGSTYVAWAWKAGNGWQSNYDGAISSLTNANTGNKFSIVRYKGTGSATTVGHDLGVSPTFIIGKTLDSAAKWRVYHSGIGATKAVNLNDTDAAGTSANYWNDTAPTTSVFSVGSDLSVNGEEHIAYVWADCDDYSKFGTYTGNGSSSGTVANVGFTPDFVLVKETTTTSDWGLFDSQRGGSSYQKALFANENDAEMAEMNVNSVCEFLPVGHSDAANGGFRFRDSGSQFNVDGNDYIFIAFKMN